MEGVRQQSGEVSFGPFRLDMANARLWRGGEALRVSPKALAVLYYLVGHPGQLVTKEELFAAVWPGVVVGDAVLTICIGELRKVLGETAKAQQYIETVHKRGYRFIAPLTPPPQGSGAGGQGSVSPPLPTPEPRPPTPLLVGRDSELSQLHHWLAKALTGERQMVFVTGEPGIGKTALVDAFLEQASAKQDVWIGRGQCVAQYGAGEAYLPILEALGRLCRESGSGQLVALLRRQAPSWLVQLPGLLNDTALDELQRKVQGVTKERMLRELAEALEVLTAEHPLVLVLEDLHWSDPSTVDLLTAVAQRREPARLLILGTYRPADVIVSGHPLRAVTQELQLHGQCAELALTFLTPDDIAQYLSVRFPQHHFPQQFGQRLQQHTEGNPLFLVNTVEDLVRRQMVVEQDGQWQLRSSADGIALGVPVSVQQLIGRQFERLSMVEQQLLEVASVAGESFSAAAVAAGQEVEDERIEEQCESLARREQFLQAQELGTWPDGTMTGRYRFLHALYQQVVYERISAARRVQLHRRIGARLETSYGERASEIAAELAVHFEHGRDYQHAVRYLEYAGKNAVRRSAHREAIIHLTKGLELLKTLPDKPECVKQELMLLVTLGSSLIVTKGFAAPDVEEAYSRAQELCRQVGETPQLFPVLRGLIVFYVVRGAVQTAYHLKQQFLSLAQHVQDPAHLTEAHYTMGAAMFTFGEFTVAREHFEQGIAFYDPQKHRTLALVYSHDPRMANLSFLAHTLWVLGYPEQALKRMHQSLAWVQELADPYNLGGGLSHAAQHHQYRREGQAAYERAVAALALASEQGFALLVAQGNIWKGAALAEQGQGADAVLLIRQGLDACSAIHSVIWRGHHLALLAEAYKKVEQPEAGLSVVTEALEFVDKTGDRSYEAEIYRLKGELTLQKLSVPSPQPLAPSTEAEMEREAEECFLIAIDIARKQQAKSLELRAVMSLGRLWQQQGKRAEAHQMLAEIYHGFTEGFDTKDLQEAKALLEALVRDE